MYSSYLNYQCTCNLAILETNNLRFSDYISQFIKQVCGFLISGITLMIYKPEYVPFSKKLFKIKLKKIV